MKKRLLSLIMAVSMVATGTGTVFAQDITEEIYAGSDDEFDIFAESDSESVDINGSDAASGSTAESDSEFSEINESDAVSDTEFEEEIEITEEPSIAPEEAEDALPSDYIEGATGYIAPENPFPIYDYTEGSDAAFLEDENLPSSYTTKLLPPLRSQGSLGLCWAFASAGLAEINALKKGIADSIDLSELHLGYFNFNYVTDPLGGTEGDFVRDPASALDGSNYNRAMDTLSSWMGLADEALVPYSYATYVKASGLQSELAYEDSIHVQNIYSQYINMDTFRNSKELSMLSPIKKEIMDKGAVGITFHSQNGYSPTTNSTVYNAANAAYYDPTGALANHAVVVIGWDNSFSKNNFSVTPPGDGAWLVRNSWTTTGDLDHKEYSGYFWMSYYDTTLENMFYSMEVESADNYDNNYQYQLSFGPTIPGTSANVYTCHAEGGEYGEELRAIAFQHESKGAPYTIKIYRQVIDTPYSGTLVPEATTSGVTTLAGYETITLNSPVRLQKGEKFAVVIDGPVGVSYNHTNNSIFGSSAERGQSYQFRDDSWIDFAGHGNFVIKAFTNNLTSSDAALPTAIEFTNIRDGNLELSVDQRFKVTARALPAGSVNKKITFKSSAPSVVTIDGNGVLKGIKAGNAVITATIEGTGVSASFNVNVVSKLVALTISGLSISFYPETEYSFLITTTPADYKPLSPIKWTSSDRDVVDITTDGRAKTVNPGYCVLTAELDGLTATKDYAFEPDYSFYRYDISEDNAVTFSWNRLPGGKVFTITDGSRTVATIDSDGRDSYEVTDNYYVGKNAESATYTITALCGSGSTLYRSDNTYSLSFGKKYNITYHLEGGTQNPKNPDTYVSGNYYRLHAPTPAEGYDFSYWSTDADLKSPISEIGKSVTGDLELYAKYSIAVTPTDDPYDPGDTDTEPDEAIEEWGDITGAAMTQELFAGVPANVPTGVWYAFGNETSGFGNIFYPRKDAPQAITYTADYTGSKVTLGSDIVVFHGNRKLAEGREYTVSYKNNTKEAPANAAKAPTVIIKGKGNYKGTSTFTFNIAKEINGEESAAGRISMSKVKVAGLATSLPYLGRPLVYEDLFASGNEPQLTYTDNKTKVKRELVRSTDGEIGDYIVICRNSGNAGKFNIVFKGINDFEGSLTKSVTIKPFNISKASEDRLKISLSEAAVYQKSGAAAAVTVEFLTDEGYVTLREGIDYKLSFKNNKAAAGKASKKAPTAVLKGIGNFTGTNSQKTFTIAKAPITDAELTAKDVTYKSNGKAGYFLAVPKLTQDGAALSEKFNKNALTYSYAEDTRLEDGSTRAAGDQVAATDKPVTGTVIKVSIPVSAITLSPNGNYYGGSELEPGAEVSGYYRVIDPYNNIGKYTATLRNSSKLTFNNGKEINITEKDLLLYRVVDNRAVNLSPNNYRITSVKSNRFLGTTTIKLEGRGIYSGTKTLKLKLTARQI